MNLIKRLLEHAEEFGNGDDIALPTISGVTEEAIAYHWGLCQEAGFIRGSHLTWDGHERLSVMRRPRLMPTA